MFFKKTQYVDAHAEAVATTQTALETFDAVVGQLTVANSYYDDAITDAEVTADWHDAEAQSHQAQAADQRLLAQSHGDAKAKNDGRIQRLRELLG